jgi:NADPH-dependent glutamate synthase beta subunit-like oxidoreductase
VTEGTLIVGGSPAGLQAALDLADAGTEVNLVEASPFLGKNADGALPPHLVNTRMLELTRHPNIRIWTNTRVNLLEDETGSLRVELQQHPRFVDLARCTGCGDCIEACPVTVPGTARKAVWLADDQQPGCAVINRDGRPPCSSACPGGIHVQGYVALVAQGRFQDALDLIREAIPFPSICGRICTHPCELKCRRAEIDDPVSIRRLKRFLADWEIRAPEATREENTKQSRPDIARRVAVVGSGPAGMTAAERLVRKGYRVTVFEKLPVMAGMMAVGIPSYRLPRAVIEREYNRILDLGVDLRLNTAIGPDGDFTLEQLFAEGYDAVCLAIGAHQSLALGIAGENLPGVEQGIAMLQTISLSQQLDDPQLRDDLKMVLKRGEKTRTIVLGGGNTAMDVARSLKRLGILDVRIVYRRSRPEMPALPEEVAETEEEGVPIEFLTAPVRILGDPQTGVVGLQCIRMKLGTPDDSGRRRPVPVAGSEFEFPVDLVVPAIGQISDIDCLGREIGIGVTRDHRIKVNDVTLATDHPGIFAAGDAITRDKMSVIEAIGMGKKAAAAIDAYLQGIQAGDNSSEMNELPVAHREMREADVPSQSRICAPVLSVAERTKSFAEVEHCYSTQQAETEARRCLSCGPCSECMACVKVCKPQAIEHKQSSRIQRLQIGSIIYADDTDQIPKTALIENKGIYHVNPDDPLMGSVAASRVLQSQTGKVASIASFQSSAAVVEPGRMGVFVCHCGDKIAAVVDTAALCRQALTWPEVIFAQELPFACAPEAGPMIAKAVAGKDLNQVILAACACCPLDMVCYSCSYQRIRCKQHFGIFNCRADLPTPGKDYQAAAMPSVAAEFVNIREQCAWAHRQTPAMATAKAVALVAAAAARARLISKAIQTPGHFERSVLVLGGGKAAGTCLDVLDPQNIDVRILKTGPFQILRSDGRYRVNQNGHTWTAEAVILVPQDQREANDLLAAFTPRSHRPRRRILWGGLETHRPRVFYCDPDRDGATTGAAAAARVSARLGHGPAPAHMTVPMVAPHRCRACRTCVEVCEFGAAHIAGQEPNRSAWIDPGVCTGCGTCAALCPSDAIAAGYGTDAQIEGMIEAVLTADEGIKV